MALQGVITPNVPAATQEITFSNPTLLDSISYGSGVITYPVASSFTLSKSDLALFAQYKTQFHNSLLTNFPSLYAKFQDEVNVVQIKIYSSSGPNIIQYYQSSTASPVNLVDNISYDRVGNTATFAARTSSISIALQEYLLAFPVIIAFCNQCSLI